MGKDYDKPKYIDVKRNNKSDTNNANTLDKVKEIFKTQSFGVLATKGDKECYTSLISFANNDDLTTIVFATPIGTKKFKFMEENNDVSILIDNRSNNENSINDIVAVTSIGTVKILKEKKDIDKWSKILISKHNYLDDFINAETTAIVVTKISKYYYVSSFQKKVELIPIEA